MTPRYGIVEWYGRNLLALAFGGLLTELLATGGHRLVRRTLNKDDIYAIRATVSVWIADPQVQVILRTSGTGFTSRDGAPEALAPVFDKTVHGFGQLFRQVPYRETGASTI